MAEAYYPLLFSYRIRLGIRVESLRDYLAAYFRGSSAGPWWPDEELERRTRLLQFSRGNWHTSERTGERMPLAVLCDSQGRSLTATRPAQLAVGVQHGPNDGTVIAIQYRYLYPVSEADVHGNRESEKPLWQKTTQAELGALRDYLRESMRLPDLTVEA